MTVAADGMLAAHVEHRTAEESSESMQIEIEDADVLRKQLEQSNAQIEELKK